VPRSERPEAAGRLLELALATRAVVAAGLVPGDNDVDEALVEVLLGLVGRAPRVFERLVGLEVLPCAGELEAFVEVRWRP
jgi:hypothetical protein